MSWDPAAERLYGWSEAEAMGKNIALVVPEARREELAAILAAASQGVRIDHLETARTRKDGFRLSVSLKLVPIKDAVGRAVGLCCVSHDLTGRQRSEEIRASLAAIVESAGAAIFSLDLRGYVVSWNRSAERLFGYSAIEMVGHNYGEIIHGEAESEFQSVFARVAAGERVIDLETKRPRRDGTMVDVLLTVSPIFAPNGSIIGESAIMHDISERKQLERDLAESRALMEHAQRVGRLGGWTCATVPDAPLICTSETFRIFGTVERANLALDDYFARVHPDDRPRVRAAALSAIAQNGHYELEHRIVRPDGEQRWVFAAGDVILDARGQPVTLAGVIQDITDRREAELKSLGLERELEMLADHSPDLIFSLRTSPDLVFEFVSPAALAITGYTPDEFYAHPDLIDRILEPFVGDMLLEGREPAAGGRLDDFEITRKDGSKLWVNQRLARVLDADGQVVGVHGILRDVSARRAAEERVEHEALHDPLTGLSNRVLVKDRIERGLSRCTREAGFVTVLVVNLDRFKSINDTRGPTRGDAVLKAVARRLESCSRVGDTVGRFSGDEFVIACENLAAITDAIGMADRTLNVFSAPFDVEGESVHVTASIGLAIGNATDTADTLLRDADLAMYRAKDRGRARYEMFDDTLRAEAERHSLVEEGLHRALDKGEFTLVFQPVWSVSENRFTGAEALIRWNDPNRGTIGPDEFIPVAEECGLIVPMGEWVLEEACAALARWNGLSVPKPGYTMSVNVSAVQLRSGGFVQTVKDVIAATKVRPEQLCLELTESVLMEDVDHVSSVLLKLQTLGVRLSIDDFGTGYSSLGYLRRFRVNEVKIDRSFISGVDSDPYDATLVSAVVAIGDALGLRVVAEGVETSAELEAVKGLGCSYIQGFFFARPCGFEECTKLLDNH
jgi:diguanylate cyclase (GGDEF)-like protein/PAS domain S-box-containing protein